MDSQVPNDNAIDFDLKERLLDKSIEAYVLALETINRLTIQYRCETFCYLFCNAWELLLKARILTDKVDDESIYYKQQKGRPRRSLSLRDCLKQVIQNPNDPTRRNLERIEELRDEAVHLVIGQIPSDVTRLFQAGVINYHRHLNEWFGESLSDRYPVGMLSIVYDRGPDEWDMGNQHLQRELGYDAAQFLTKFCAEVRNEHDILERSSEFTIGIEYRLALTKRNDDADIALTSGPFEGEPVQVVQVAKDPSVSHPFREKEVIKEVNASLMGHAVNSHDIRCLNRVYGLKMRPEYFYQGKVKGSPGQYSNTYVEWVVKRYESAPLFFDLTREKYRSMKDSYS